MKISLEWLTEFNIDIEEYLKEPQNLSDLLTNAGLEVEGISDQAKDFGASFVSSRECRENLPALRFMGRTTMVVVKRMRSRSRPSLTEGPSNARNPFAQSCRP